MANDFITVYARTEVNTYEKACMNNDEIQKRIKYDLANELANYIINHTDKIPVEISKVFNSTNYREDVCEEVTMSVNIISNEEYKRLKMIEDMYDISRFSR